MLVHAHPPVRPDSGRMRDHDDGESAGVPAFGSQDGPELLAIILPESAPRMRPKARKPAGSFFLPAAGRRAKYGLTAPAWQESKQETKQESGARRRMKT